MALPTDAGAPRRAQPLARLLMVAIVTYQRLLSPHLGARCRYVPSCSAYAYQALLTLPLLAALACTAKRLWRCAPWGHSGLDPVPHRLGRQATATLANLPPCPGPYTR